MAPSKRTWGRSVYWGEFPIAKPEDADEFIGICERDRDGIVSAELDALRTACEVARAEILRPFPGTREERAAESRRRKAALETAIESYRVAVRDALDARKGAA